MNVSDFAATIRNKHPAYANVPDDELVRAVVTKYPQYASQVDMSVADTAAARLASRGLTPEAIKANPSLAVSSPDDFQYTSAIPRPGALDYLGAAGGALAGMIPTENPTNPAAMASMIANTAAGYARDSVQADIDFSNDPVRRRIQKTTAAIPVVGGIAHDLLQPSFVAPEREPRPDERLDAMGAAVQVGALAGPGALKGTLAKGSGMAARAESAYAGIAEPPLTETMARQMMDRGIKGSAEKIAANASKAEQAAIATKEALIRDNPMPERYRSTPARRGVMGQVRSAGDEAKFQADVQTVAESIKKPTTTGGNILTGKVGKIARMVPGVDAAMHIAGTVKALYEFPGTTAFKTTTALWRRKFGQAMSQGDHALAAEIGAGIATGALAVDDFGHRAVITQLAQEAEQAGPELRRQVVASKKFFYTDPSGGTVEIPHNVASAMTDADVSEADSPINKWLTAMEKQKKIKTGGTIGYR